MIPSRRSRRLALLTLAVLLALGALAANVEAQQAAAGKPNIVIIWGDDVGQSNISAYSHGVMGYKTPTSTGSPGKA
jgi:arylsulfatase